MKSITYTTLLIITYIIMEQIGKWKDYWKFVLLGLFLATNASWRYCSFPRNYKRFLLTILFNIHMINWAYISNVNEALAVRNTTLMIYIIVMYKICIKYSFASNVMWRNEMCLVAQPTGDSIVNQSCNQPHCVSHRIYGMLVICSMCT